MNCFRHIVIALGLMAAASCSNDDTTPPRTLQPELPGKKDCRLVSIVHNGAAPYCYNWAFTYSADRLAKGTGSKMGEAGEADTYTSTLTYGAETVALANSGNRPMTLTLNSEGLVSYMKVGKDVYEFLYLDKRLAEWKKTINDEYFGSTAYRSSATLQYVDGDLKTIVYVENDAEPVTLYFTPSEHLNHNGLLPETVFNELGCFGFEHLYYAGLLGQPTKYLVGEVTTRGYRDESRNVTVHFDYFTSEEGNTEVCNYSYKGQPASVVYGYANNK